MQTDKQTAQDRVVATRATTQRSIYNSLNMLRITMYLYVERDFVVGISYTGIQWLYLIIKVHSYLCNVIMWTLWMACWKCSALSVALYSEIKILSTLAITQSFIQFVMTMKTMRSSWQQGDLKKKLKIWKTCFSNYTTAPNGSVAMAISYLITTML